MYLGAMYWVWVFDWPDALKLLVTAVLLFSAVMSARRYILLSGSRSISRVICEDGESWSLETAQGRTMTGTLVGGTCFQPWLVVMNFRVEGEFRSWPVVLMNDSTDSTSFRRLQVKLRALNSF